MDWKIKFISKNYIFNKGKFITEETQLQDHEKKTSIGHLFLQVMQQNHKDPIDDVKAFWYSSKKLYIQQLMRSPTQCKMQSNQYGSARIMCVFFTLM